eukprot:441754-Pelagomonas_calceolata.AAC.3
MQKTTTPNRVRQTHQLNGVNKGFTRDGLQPETLADRLLETQALPASPKKIETKSDKKSVQFDHETDGQGPQVRARHQPPPTRVTREKKASVKTFDC